MADSDPTLDAAPGPIPDADVDVPVEAEETETELEAEPDGMLALSQILPISQYVVTRDEWNGPRDRRVEYALDDLLIAACERAARILRSDLGA